MHRMTALVMTTLTLAAVFLLVVGVAGCAKQSQADSVAAGPVSGPAAASSGCPLEKPGAVCPAEATGTCPMQSGFSAEHPNCVESECGGDCEVCPNDSNECAACPNVESCTTCPEEQREAGKRIKAEREAKASAEGESLPAKPGGS